MRELIRKILDLRVWFTACGLQVGPKRCRDNDRENERIERERDRILKAMGLDLDRESEPPEPMTPEMLERLADIDLTDGEDWSDG